MHWGHRVKAGSGVIGRIVRSVVIAICVGTVVMPVLLLRASSVAIVDAETLLSAPLGEHTSDVLLLQGTALAGRDTRYVLTLSNLSPWPIDGIRVLDRFFEPQADEELSYVWDVGMLDPDESASVVITYEGVEFPSACHQLEITWASVWHTFVIDCGSGGRTAVWEIPVQEEMAAQAPAFDLPLSLPEPVGRSKMGLHVTRNASPAIMEFVERAQPSVIVAVGDLGWLAEIKEVSPETMTLGRFEERGQVFVGDPRQRATELVSYYAGRYLANPGVDYWLGWNEPVIKHEWQMTWYATFEAERARLMDELGLKVGIGNFSTGTPEADLFPAFMPALEAASEYGGVFAVHEYSAPSMLDGVGAPIPGHEAAHDFGALTLRYRFWYEHYLGPAGLMVPLVVTEAGIDGGVLKGQDPSLGGWRDFDGEVAEYFPVHSLRTFLNEVSWYDDELRRDPYVVGFALFNVGDRRGQWSSWDITNELPYFADLALSKQ